MDDLGGFPIIFGNTHMTQIDGKIVGSLVSKRDTILLQHSQGEAAVKTT